ncbi:unnamed protein product [Leptosia nina]|uniref:RING-type E3 ubiquitin transferase n=1 Tax=Leptosia nina TaxID=320188 RepID=A0AAV1IXZ2_9NEOP
MADALVQNRPRILFFCHRCYLEFEEALHDYTCPFCESPFIEQLEDGSEGLPNNGHTFSDANMSNIDDANYSDNSNSDQPFFPLNNLPPVLQDIAFLMSGDRFRDATRHHPITAEIGWALSGGHGGAPPGTITAGAPLVLLGAPGDYVFGGEALDAVVTQLLGQLEHSGPPPMPRDILNSIPDETVTEEQVAANMSCSVCWETFQLGETVSKLECEHIFHKPCIKPWLELHATCPICRRSLLPPDQSPSNTTATTTTPNTTSNSATNNPDPPRLRPALTPRVVIRRSTHPLFRRSFQTHTWDSPRNMSISSDSSSSITTGGLWAPQTRTDSNSDSSTSVSDRTQNYHTDFDCD